MKYLTTIALLIAFVTYLSPASAATHAPTRTTIPAAAAPAATVSPSKEDGPSEYLPSIFGYKLKVTDFFIAFFNLGLFGSTILLWRSAEKTTRHQTRAHVYFKELRIPAIRDPNTEQILRYKLIPSFKNGGGSTTRKMIVTTNWCSHVGDLPQNFGYDYTGTNIKTTAMVLGPEAEGASMSFDIPATDINAVLAGTTCIYFWGKVTYFDPFSCPSGYETRFCFKVLAESTGGTNAFIGYSYYGDYNRTEEG